jgi:hypothetical protein
VCFAVVDAIAAEPVDLAEIGVHPVSRIGPEAISLVLGMPPSTTVVVGAAGDIDVLASAFACGARGMRLWETASAPVNES